MTEEPEVQSRATKRVAVREHFARLSRTYGGGEYYAKRRAAVIHALEPELASARRVLDLGCGNGRYIAEFRRVSSSVSAVGADLSAEMLAEAMARGGGRTPLVRADALALPFREESFDLICASHVLPFVDDLGAAVRGVARCLSACGVLAATVGQGGVPEAMRAAVGEAQWSRFAVRIFGGIGRDFDAAASEEHHRAAFERAALETEVRVAPFSVGWAAMEEWIRLRWMPVRPDEDRDFLTRLLCESAPLCARHRFDLEERLLIGRKSAGSARASSG